MKRILAIVLTIMLVLSLAACSTAQAANETTAPKTEGSQTEAPEVDEGSKELILTVIITDPYFLSIEKVFRELAEKDGYTVTVMDPNIKNETLQKMIEDITVKQPAGVAFAPWDDSHVNMAKQLIDAGLNVVAYNVPLTENLIPTIINDDYAGGVVGGKAAAETWKRDYVDIEPVLGVVGQPEIGVCVQRADGFIEGFKSLYPDVKIVPLADGKGDRAKSLAVASDMIQANPDANCFFGINDSVAMGIVDALQEQNMADPAKVMVTGFGGASLILEEMKKPDSVVKCEVGCQPATMGELTYKALIEAINGEGGYKEIMVPAINVTVDTADEFMAKQYPVD